jgi:hypothetical protein
VRKKEAVGNERGMRPKRSLLPKYPFASQNISFCSMAPGAMDGVHSQCMLRDRENLCSVRPIYSEDAVDISYGDADKISDLKARITDKLGIDEKYQALSNANGLTLANDARVCDVHQPVVMRATLAGGANCGLITTIPELLQGIPVVPTVLTNTVLTALPATKFTTAATSAVSRIFRILQRTIGAGPPAAACTQSVA